MNNKVALLLIFSFICLFAISCNTDPFIDSGNRALDLVEQAIDDISKESSDWRTTLEQLSEDLPNDVQSTIRVEVDAILQRATQAVNSSIQCNVDFIRTRIKSDLQQLIPWKKEGEVGNPLYAPTFCSAVPDEIVMDLSPSRRTGITFQGYNLKIDRMKVEVRDNINRVLIDATSALSRPHHYSIELNLSGSGVILDDYPTAAKIVFVVDNEDKYSINIKQPTLPLCGTVETMQITPRNWETQRFNVDTQINEDGDFGGDVTLSVEASFAIRNSGKDIVLTYLKVFANECCECHYCGLSSPSRWIGTYYPNIIVFSAPEYYIFDGFNNYDTTIENEYLHGSTQVKEITFGGNSFVKSIDYYGDKGDGNDIGYTGVALNFDRMNALLERVENCR